MKTRWRPLVIVTLFSLLLSAISNMLLVVALGVIIQGLSKSDPGEQKVHGVFRPLKLGQVVSLSTYGEKYFIGPLHDELATLMISSSGNIQQTVVKQLGNHSVDEIGSDYIVLRQRLAEGTPGKLGDEIRIPVHAIGSVTPGNSGQK